MGSDGSRTRACPSHVPQPFPRRLRPTSFRSHATVSTIRREVVGVAYRQLPLGLRRSVFQRTHHGRVPPRNGAQENGLSVATAAAGRRGRVSLHRALGGWDGGAPSFRRRRRHGSLEKTGMHQLHTLLRRPAEQTQVHTPLVRPELAPGLVAVATRSPEPTPTTSSQPCSLPSAMPSPRTSLSPSRSRQIRQPRLPTALEALSRTGDTERHSRLAGARLQRRQMRRAMLPISHGSELATVSP